MLKELLKTVYCDKDIPFENSEIVFFSPCNSTYYKIAFGDGSDEDAIDDCDDYLYIECDILKEDGTIMEDADGGNMWFHRKDYTGHINDYNLILNALDFIGCPSVEELVFVKKN